MRNAGFFSAYTRSRPWLVFVGGLAAGVALVPIGMGFGGAGLNLAAIVILPALGFTAGALAAGSGPGSPGFWSIATLYGLGALGPIALVDPEEASLILGFEDVGLWALIAGIVHDTCNLADAPNCKRAAGFSLIPLIGPFLTIPYLKTDAIMPKVAMALPALVQIAGFTMAVIGTAQFVADGKASRVADIDGFKLGAKLRLNVGPTRFLDGGTLTLGARF